jgi:hypothetical protein
VRNLLKTGIPITAAVACLFAVWSWAQDVGAYKARLDEVSKEAAANGSRLSEVEKREAEDRLDVRELKTDVKHVLEGVQEIKRTLTNAR